MPRKFVNTDTPCVKYRPQNEERVQRNVRKYNIKTGKMKRCELLSHISRLNQHTQLY